MRKLLILLLIGSFWQAHAQRRPALAPLRPLAVSLDSGQTLKRALIGIDPAAYQRVRAWQATSEQVHRLDSLRLVVASAEVARLRLELATAYGLLDAQKALTQQALARPARPMLLDKNFYRGYVAGLFTGGFLGAKYLPHF